MAFGTSFCLENQLERLSKPNEYVRKWSRSVDQNQEILVLHFVYIIKNIDQNFQSFCVSKIAIKEQNFTLPNESKDHYQASVSMASFNSS